MARVHNFSAGPAALPTSVLAEIADEMMDYRGCGMSVLEMSHRSSMYQQIIDDAEATLRRLLSIPDNYRVLFLQGGATLQFAGIPMNLMHRGRAGYIVTGNFANKAYKEAAKYGEAVLLASSEDTNFDRIPDMADINARIAAEAAKQAGRAMLPHVALPLNDFAAVCKAFSNFDVVLFFYEGGGAPLREVLHPGQYKRVAIVTGSEGGFSVEEAEAAKAAGAVTVGLGPRILRCETAPLAALTSVMLLTGNLE